MKITIIDGADERFASAVMAGRMTPEHATDPDGACIRTFLKYLEMKPFGEEVRICRKGLLVQVSIGNEKDGFSGACDDTFSKAALVAMASKKGP